MRSTVGSSPTPSAVFSTLRTDPEAKIGRPRQIYTGYAARDYNGMDKR